MISQYLCIMHIHLIYILLLVLIQHIIGYSTFLNFLKFFSPLQTIPLSSSLCSSSLQVLLSPAALTIRVVLTISTCTSSWEKLITPTAPPTRPLDSGELKSSLLVRRAKRPSLDTYKHGKFRPLMTTNL